MGVMHNDYHVVFNKITKVLNKYNVSYQDGIKVLLDVIVSSEPDTTITDPWVDDLKGLVVKYFLQQQESNEAKEYLH